MGMNNKVAPLEAVQVSTINNNTDSDKNKVLRRSDIDVLRIVLTWGILLYHVSLIYSPYARYYVKIIPEDVPNWHLLVLWFTFSMELWNMPMFFFLSGIRLVDC